MSALPMVAEGSILGGRYRIVRELGRGGMGIVYEAVQQDLNRRVALKVLLAFGGGPQLERFRREAQSAAALGHPNIVQVSDFQVPRDGPAFLVMEFLEGISLGALIDKQGPLPYPRVAFITTQVLAALAAAHRAGIIHRDIKPDNVFLTATPVAHDLVKLLDFGIAKVESPDFAPMTVNGQVMGSPAYMPPEQARGQQVDARADVFAVGASMYHAITGRLPTPPTDDQALTMEAPRSIMAAASLSILRPDLPTGFTAIVDRAMMADPAKRYTTADEMRAAVALWSPPTSSPQLVSAGPSAPPPPALAGGPVSMPLPSTMSAPMSGPMSMPIGPTMPQPFPSSTLAAPTVPRPVAPSLPPAPPGYASSQFPGPPQHPSYAPPPPQQQQQQHAQLGYAQQAHQAQAAQPKRGVSMLLIAVLVIIPSLAIVAAALLFYLRPASGPLGQATPTASSVPAGTPSPVASATAAVAAGSARPGARPTGTTRAGTPSPSAVTATANATTPAAATAAATTPPALPAGKKIRVVVGGLFSGHFGRTGDAIAAIQAHQGELAACLSRFDPVPEKQAARDYVLTLDGNARPVDAQPNNDAVDRCVTPILKRSVFPAFQVPLINETTTSVRPRITWFVE